MPQIGQKVRDYFLEAQIGEGGMGEVWRARHAVLPRQVAIKVMARQLAADPKFEERFIKEAQAQAALQHPRIVGVTDFFSEDGVYYLVMPLMTGMSLEQRLAASSGPLPVAEALAIARDLLDALDYAHRNKVIHRDVKPSNVMLDHEGHAYLMDFGIALPLGQRRLTSTGTSLGTPHYMSPEQIRNPKKLDHRADVYSAGCVIYEMLAGRPPFVADAEGDTDFIVKEAHIHQAPPPVRTWNPAVPPALDDVVLHSLEKDPDKRYGGCGEFRLALDGWDRPGTAASPPPLPAPLPSLPPQLPGPVAPQLSKPGTSPVVWLVVGLVIFLAILGVISGTKKTEETEVEETPATSAAAMPVQSEEPMGTDMGAPPPMAEPTSQQAPTTASTQDTSFDVPRGLLNLFGQALGNGYEKGGDYFNALPPTGTNDLTVNLSEGQSYAIAGFCDSNCSDIDLTLFDTDGSILTQDILADDHPVLQFSATRSATLTLRVMLVKCSAADCKYGVAVYRKLTSTP